MDDLIELEFGTGPWINRSSPAIGLQPSARFGHGMTWYEGTLYIHGGFNNEGDGSDFQQLMMFSSFSAPNGLDVQFQFVEISKTVECDSLVSRTVR